MADIYRNAICTLAAHPAEDDSHGFISATTASNSVIRALLGVSTWTASQRSSFKDQVNNSVLSQRGWVFQERIVSTRILHFVDPHLFLEDVFGVKADDGSTEDMEWHSPWADARISLEDVFDSIDWYRLVERYSLCALTFDRDRLQAIAGLVSLIQSRRNDVRYSSGMWIDSLEKGLLWLSTDKPLQRPEYSAQFSPPSWSWAHWKGPIQYPKLIAEFHRQFNFVGIEGNSEVSTGPRQILGQSESRNVLCIQTLQKRMTGLQQTYLRTVPSWHLESMYYSERHIQKLGLLSEHVVCQDNLRELFKADNLSSRRFLG